MASSLALMKRQINKYSKIYEQKSGGQNKENANSPILDLPIQINSYSSFSNHKLQNRQSTSYQSQMPQKQQSDNIIQVANDFLKELLEKQQRNTQQPLQQYYMNSIGENKGIDNSSPHHKINQRPSTSKRIRNENNKEMQDSIHQSQRAFSTEKQRPSTSYQAQQYSTNSFEYKGLSPQPAAQAFSYSPFVKQTFSSTFYKNNVNNAQTNQNQIQANHSTSPNMKPHGQQNNFILKFQKSFDKQGNKILIIPRKDSGVKMTTKIIKSQSRNIIMSGTNNNYNNNNTNNNINNISSHMVKTEPDDMINDQSNKSQMLQISKYNHRQFVSGLNEERYALQVKKSREDFSQITRCNRVSSADINHKRNKRYISLHQTNPTSTRPQLFKGKDSIFQNYLSSTKGNLLFNTPLAFKRQRIQNQEITPWDNNQVSQSDLFSDVFNQSPKNQFSPVKNSLLFNSNTNSSHFPRPIYEQKLINLQKSIQQQSKAKEEKIIEKTIIQTPKKAIPVNPQPSNTPRPKTSSSASKSGTMRKISEKIEDNSCKNNANTKECDILPLTNYNDVITSKNISKPLRPVSKHTRKEQIQRNTSGNANHHQRDIIQVFKRPLYRCDKGLFTNHRINCLNAVLQSFRNIPFIRDFLMTPQPSNIFIPSLLKLYEQLDLNQEPTFMNTLSQFFQSFLTSQQNRGDNELKDVEIIINVVIEQLLYNARPYKQVEIRLTRLSSFSQNDEDACDLFEEMAFSHQNNEIFLDMFGLLKYKFQCSECGNEERNLEDFYIFKTIKMEINRYQSDFVNNLYTTGRAEANYCDYCMKDILFFQKMEFIQLPKLLIIPLQIKVDQYYSNVNSYTSKNVFNQLDIPEEFQINDIYKNKISYKLIGEIDKTGNSSQYKSIFKDRKGNIQQYLDNKVNFKENFSLDSAQVLFYIRTDETDYLQQL